jgi:hypothetical protein
MLPMVQDKTTGRVEKLVLLERLGPLGPRAFPGGTSKNVGVAQTASQTKRLAVYQMTSMSFDGGSHRLYTPRMRRILPQG